jgi:hypothetical protein
MLELRSDFEFSSAFNENLLFPAGDLAMIFAVVNMSDFHALYSELLRLLKLQGRRQRK